MTGTRDRLVDVTRDLVHAASYADVSVADVCAAAGVNKGSLYHFFPSKQALGVAVVDRNWDLVRGLLDASLDGRGAPLDRLDRFLVAYTAQMRTMRGRLGSVPGCPLGNLASEVSAQDPELREHVAAAMAAWTTRVEFVLREAAARGDLAAGGDPAALARGVIACVQGVTVLAKAADDPALLDDLVPLVRRLLPTP